MAERVVDGFEAVEVDKHEGEPRAFARRVRDTLLQPVVDEHAVRQAGERVARGQEFGALFGRFTFGDVGDGTGHAQRTAARVALRDLAFRMQPHPFLGLAGGAEFALKIVAGTLGRGDQRLPEAFAIFGMIPRHDLVAAVYDAVAFGCPRTEQGAPVLAEKYLVVGQIPIPDGEA